MKARIKATGEIVDLAPYTRVCEDFAKGRSWLVEELDDADDVPDYWEKLKHQAAISAMQGVLSNHEAFGKIVSYYGDDDTLNKAIANKAVSLATALVEKLKKEK